MENQLKEGGTYIALDPRVQRGKGQRWEERWEVMEAGVKVAGYI